MKTARSATPAASIRSSSRSHRAAASSPFNARGVVERPSFTLAPAPAVPAGGIELRVKAHPVGVGDWIAQYVWACRQGSLPADGMPLHDKSTRFATRSEAVEDAMNRCLRQVASQRHRKSALPEWKLATESLRDWVADAMFDVRAADETLPLRGATVADLFAGGSGGFGVALTGLGASVELACEIDPVARAVYERNVRPKAMHADICSLDARKLSVDVVTMGLLCQAFSAAGKHLGFADPKLAKAYKAAVRVLGEVDAKVIIIECARQLLTLDGGKNADELFDALMSAGYRVQHRALNAAHFGLAQSRERSFIVATRVGLDVDDLLGVLFPEEREPTAVVADIMDKDIAASIPASEIDIRRAEPSERTNALVQIGHIAGRSSQGYRVYSGRGLGPSLTAQGGGKARFTGAYAVKGGARTLSPREAMRRQGMPEWATHHPIHLHAMRHAGNAVAVPVARELGRVIGALLSQRDERVG